MYMKKVAPHWINNLSLLLPFCKMLKQLLVSTVSATKDGLRPHGFTEEYNLHLIIYIKTHT